MTAVETVMRKEWAETLRNRTILFTWGLLSVMFLAMPLGLGLLLPSLLGPEVAGSTEGLPDNYLQLMPSLAGLPPLAQAQVFLLRQFLPLFLVLPVMAAISIATYSIIGEKTSRSLEAVLATPITTEQLLLGKSLASTIPAVLGTWLIFLIYAVIVIWRAGTTVARYVLDPATLTMIILITPLVALLALGLGVLVSARVSDPRSAQQVGVIVILPIIAIMIGQSVGLFLLGLPFVFMAAIILAILDGLVFVIGVRVFQRETILTRWR
ncbi:MAG: ABC transporter permease [Anaerolineae bacterium]